MGNWYWIFYIAAGLVLGVTAFFILNYIARETGRSIAGWIWSARYRRRAKKRNEEARLKRLEATTYLGWPLPTGKEGTLRITYHDQMNLTAMSTVHFEKAYFDRARDLGVDLQYMVDTLTRDIVVRWKPAKKKQKEVY